MAKLNAQLKLFMDRPGFMKKVSRWQFAILSRTGAYGRGVMQKQIRPALKGTRGKQVITVTPAQLGTLARLNFARKGRLANQAAQLSRRYNVPNDLGKPVTDASTGKMVTREEAAIARKLARKKRRGGGRRPPRSKTGKLRSNILFATDATTESVVIGAKKFAFQPAMVNRVAVPQLLNRGGEERVKLPWGGFEWVKYRPFPFIETVQSITLKKMAQFIRQRPLHRR